ncbi:MAG: tripartite tricarboxylate transporter TctB family protein [Firmicutes bacterium]|jgi:putative tricarboxylic transport membrane protein|nr:tripartite tricarboxylate transporter TctB family protein [Bacillota bacterium]
MTLDAKIALILILLGGFLCRATFSLPGARFDRLGPAFFPRVVSIILVALSVFLALDSLRSNKKDDVRMREEGAKAEYSMILFLMVLLCLYVLFLKRLGYLVTTSLFLIVSMLVLNPESKRFLPKVVLLSLAIATGIHVVFGRFLGVMLP